MHLLTRRGIRRTTMGAAISIALALVVGLASTAFATESRRGSCSGGPGYWRLAVGRVDADTLRVRFRIEDVPPGQTWQIFLSDDGVRVFTGERVSDSNGEVRVRRLIPDRGGADTIGASGVSATGITCSGSLTF
jgi:hypothetical protein